MGVRRRAEASEDPRKEDEQTRANVLERSRAILKAEDSGGEPAPSLGNCCRSCRLQRLLRPPPHRISLLLPPAATADQREKSSAAAFDEEAVSKNRDRGLIDGVALRLAHRCIRLRPMELCDES